MVLLYTEPPEEFSIKMSNRQFLLYLNVNGIHYDVCKKLKGKLEIYNAISKLHNIIIIIIVIIYRK